MEWLLLIGTIAAIFGIVTGIWFLWDKIKPALSSLRMWTTQGFVKRKNAKLAEMTYLRYRATPTPLVESVELIKHLEARHKCSAFHLAGKAFPVTVIWKNADKQIHPDEILGELDKRHPTAFSSSPILKPQAYVQARKFIKQMFEAGPIKYEGRNYRMMRIDISSTIPKIHGAFGLYYDNILTQYAMEWELKKALLRKNGNPIHALSKKGSLPLRESYEAQENPIVQGARRCAAITVSTLVVFNRRGHGFHCLIHRRSTDVGVSPNMIHVVPAGMFEAKNLMDHWSVEINVWRELLEEVYGRTEQQGSGEEELPDYVRREEPIKSLIEMIKQGSAQLSVTGICSDLLNLRPEVCTILYVEDPAFAEERKMSLNWEYTQTIGQGVGAVPWNRIDEFIETTVNKFGLVASAAACLGLGREWVRCQHGM